MSEYAQAKLFYGVGLVSLLSHRKRQVRPIRLDAQPILLDFGAGQGWLVIAIRVFRHR